VSAASGHRGALATIDLPSPLEERATAMSGFVRSNSFIIPGASGAPGVRVYIEERNGALFFQVEVLDTSAATADLRGLFFRVVDAAKLAGLQVTESDGTVTDFQAIDNRVIDLGNGANMNGTVSRTSAFDVGVEFGTAGMAADDIQDASFTLSNTANNLTLDDVAQTLFGVRLTSVGDPDGARSDSAKLTAVSSAAPDARDDTYSIFEDGAADLDDPRSSAAAVVFQVLANDTDADGNPLTITHLSTALTATGGTVEIIDGGTAIRYTPFTDFAGTDSFVYAISDGNGGTDFATVSLSVVAVADVPALTYEILAGSTVNEVIVRVTATTTDDDGSEFIDSLAFSGVPADVSIVATDLDPADQPGSLTRDFVLTVPLDQSTDFTLGVTATAKETSNGDTETNTINVAIDYDYKATDLDTTFEAVNQSMWGSGGAFTFVDDRFIGIDESLDGGFNAFLFATTEGNLKAGFQSTLNFTGGRVDAELPYEITVDTNYNKTTDVMVIGSSAALLPGGGFSTTGPGGSYTLDFIFELFFALRLGLDFGELGQAVFVDDTLIDIDEELNILDLDSSNLGFTLELPLGFSIDFAWPDIDTVSDSTNVYNSSGASNDFLALNLDVDDFITKLLKLPINPFAPGFSVDIGVAAASVVLELLDLDLGIGLNFLQDFALAVNSLSTAIQLEDGTILAYAIGDELTLTDASSYDTDNDGNVEFALLADPQATMSNSTDLGFNFNWNFDILKGSYNFEIFGESVGSDSFGPLVDLGGTIPIAAVDVFDNSFALDFQSKNLDFFA
jgi:hypothetical protein